MAAGRSARGGSGRRGRQMRDPRLVVAVQPLGLVAVLRELVEEPLTIAGLDLMYLAQNRRT